MERGCGGIGWKPHQPRDGEVMSTGTPLVGGTG
jgi:hypothetical protein